MSLRSGLWRRCCPRPRFLASDMKPSMHRIKLLTAAVSALFLLLVSAVLGYTELYIMSAAVMAVPFVSFVAGRIGMSRLQCARDALHFARENEPFQVRLSLLHKSGLIGPMEIADKLPEWIVKQDGSEDEDDSMASYTAIARKRGEYTIGPAQLHASDLLGFFRLKGRYPITSELVVFPSPLVVPELEIRPMGSLGEYQFDGTGAKGSGIDFHGVREYHIGDELRRVHWRSTAKHGRLNVIEFEHSRAQDIIVAIDLKRGSEVGTGLHTSLEYAVRIAAGIVQQTLVTGGCARIVGDGVTGAASVFGREFGHLHVLLDALAHVQADREKSLSEVLMGELGCIRDNTAITCLASAIDDDMVSCAELLRARGIKLQFILINVLGDAWQEPLESALARTGASVVVMDCSTHEVAGHVRYQYAI